MADLNRKKFTDDIRKIGKETFIGERTFSDTGKKSNASSAMDSVFGAPVRTAISELQKGNINLDTVKKIVGQIGRDPSTAPTGVDIAEQATSNPYLGAGIATAVDIAGKIPTPGGIAGRVDVGPRLSNAMNSSKLITGTSALESGLKKLLSKGDIKLPKTLSASEKALLMKLRGQ